MRRVSQNNRIDAGQAGDDLDLGGIGQALRKSKKWIIGATLLGLIGSAAFVTLVKPRYTAEAKALIENQESYFTRPERTGADGSATATAPDPEAVTSQVQLVTSRDLSREAIKALNLKGNLEFDPAASGASQLSGILQLLGLQADTSNLAPEDRIFTNYFDRLTVFPVVKSRVLQIEFTSQDPELAARAANTIADLYVNMQAKTKRDNARVAATSLASLIADLRTRVSDAERKAEEFRAANGLMLGANNVSMNSQQMSELNGQLSLARTAQAQAQAKARMIRDMLRQGRIGEVSDVASNDLIVKLSEQRATLRGQIASEARTLLAGHPRVKELNAQLSELDNNLKIVADRTAKGLENDARIAGSHVENLQAALERQKKTVGGASVDEAHARELDREAKLLKEQLEFATTKYQEALARQAAESTPSDVRIISRAVAPQLPTFPKKVPIVIFATLACFLLSAGSVIASELLSGRAYVRNDDFSTERIEPSLAPALVQPVGRSKTGETPPETTLQLAGEIAGAPQRPAEAKSAEAKSAEGKPDGAKGKTMAEALAGVASRISSKSRSGIAVRILVTGAVGDTDAAQQAVALGRTLSLDRRAVLVELEGDRSDVQDSPLGLSDLLAGRAEFDAVIYKDQESSLHLMPVGREGHGLAPGFDTVIDALAETYDYLIVLAPPVGVGPAARLMAPEVEFTMLVCGVGTRVEDATRAYEELRRAGAVQVLAISDGEPPSDPAGETRRQAA